MPNREEVIQLKESGKSYREIAAILNMPLGTVRSICLREKKKETVIVCLYCGKPVTQGMKSTIITITQKKHLMSSLKIKMQ